MNSDVLNTGSHCCAASSCGLVGGQHVNANVVRLLAHHKGAKPQPCAVRRGPHQHRGSVARESGLVPCAQGACRGPVSTASKKA